jgi:hypothetical protein
MKRVPQELRDKLWQQAMIVAVQFEKKMEPIADSY